MFPAPQGPPGAADDCLRDAEERLARCARFLEDPALSRLLVEDDPARFSPPDTMAKLLGENVHLRARLEEGKALLRGLCTLATAMVFALGRQGRGRGASGGGEGENEGEGAPARAGAAGRPGWGRRSEGVGPAAGSALSLGEVERISTASGAWARDSRSAGPPGAYDPREPGLPGPAARSQFARSAITLECLACSSSDQAAGSPSLGPGGASAGQDVAASVDAGEAARGGAGADTGVAETLNADLPDGGAHSPSPQPEGAAPSPTPEVGPGAPGPGVGESLTLSTLQPGPEEAGGTGGARSAESAEQAEEADDARESAPAPGAAEPAGPVGEAPVEAAGEAPPRVRVGNTILPDSAQPPGAGFVQGHYSVNASMFAAADSAIAASASRAGDSLARALAKSELEAQYLRRERDILLRSQTELRELLGVKDEECRLLRIRAEAAERRLPAVARSATRPAGGAGEPRGAGRPRRAVEPREARGGPQGWSDQADVFIGDGTISPPPPLHPSPLQSARGQAGLPAIGAPGGEEVDDDALLESQLQALASIRQAVVDIREDLSFQSLGPSGRGPGEV